MESASILILSNEKNDLAIKMHQLMITIKILFLIDNTTKSIILSLIK